MKTNDNTVSDDLLAATKAYQQAVRKLDVDAVSSTWAEDGVMWATQAADVRGRPAIRALLASSYPHVTIEGMVFETHEIERRADIALELATYRERIRVGAEPARDLRGRYILVWKRQKDGAWRIDHGIYNYSDGSVSHAEAADVPSD
jgi:ketosteroid isomerase-like protein